MPDIVELGSHSADAYPESTGGISRTRTAGIAGLCLAGFVVAAGVSAAVFWNRPGPAIYAPECPSPGPDAPPNPTPEAPYNLAAPQVEGSKIINDANLEAAKIKPLQDLIEEANRLVSPTSLRIIGKSYGQGDRLATFDKGELQIYGSVITNPKTPNEPATAIAEALLGEKGYWEKVGAHPDSPTSRAYTEAFKRLSCDGVLERRWEFILWQENYSPHTRVSDTITRGDPNAPSVVLTANQVYQSLIYILSPDHYPEFKATFNRQSPETRKLLSGLISAQAETLTEGNSSKQSTLENLIPAFRDFRL
ncbi:MAG TPA: hypothetical protein VLG37_02810 [Candidatus Saccharimonadales bacterium]|nr:hypothetical protein [Candidatus Saccharimonadales bacterium]